MTEPLLVSVKEAYTMLGISRAHFYRQVERGIFRIIPIGRRATVSVKALRDWVAAQDEVGRLRRRYYRRQSS